jgi:phage shock protein PspC (stress-responsive transcriptional regulator)/predicted membrane protein
MMTTEQPPQVEPTIVPGLVRPLQGRVFAGVAAGIAKKTGIPLWLVRVLFVIAATMGGAGVLAYLAGWLLIPAEGSSDAIASGLVENLGPAGWIGLGVAVVGLMAINSSIDFLPGDALFGLILVVFGVLVYMGRTPLTLGPRPATDQDRSTEPGAVGTAPARYVAPLEASMAPPATGTPIAPMPSVPPPPPRPKSPLGRLTWAVIFITLGTMAIVERVGSIEIAPRHYVAVAMGLVGAGLLVGAWFGRSRGLIVAGFLLVPALVLSPLAEVDFGTFNRVVFAPTTVSEIQEVYSEDVASMIVDLSQVDFTGETVAVATTSDLGEVIVIVPDDVAVTGRARVDVGVIEVFDVGPRGGIGSESVAIARTGTAGALDLRLTVGAGRILVTSDPDDPRIEDVPASTPGNPIVIDDLADLEERYEVGAGSLTFDLTGLELSQSANLRVQLGAGEITVLLPPEVSIDVDATAGLGEVDVRGRTDAGFSPRISFDEPDALLELDLSVGAGSIQVREQS